MKKQLTEEEQKKLNDVTIAINHAVSQKHQMVAFAIDEKGIKTMAAIEGATDYELVGLAESILHFYRMMPTRVQVIAAAKQIDKIVGDMSLEDESEDKCNCPICFMRRGEL